MTSELDQPFRLDAKVALVTGGASGIGAATCRELARAGADVLIADVNLKAAQEFARELKGARALEMDVTSAKSIAKAAKEISRLDILVNNAGIGLVGDIATTEEEDFDRVMRVNVYSVYLATRALLPLLLERWCGISAARKQSSCKGPWYHSMADGRPHEHIRLWRD